MLRLVDELKNNSISRFHLLYGEERYLVRYYKKMLLDKLSTPGDEMNCTFFQGEDCEEKVIADAGLIFPFFAEHRLLVVQDSGFFKGSNDMPEYLESFPPSTYVIFVEREVDKRNRLFKWMGKNGCITECVAQDEGKLKQWIAGYLKKEGKTISQSAAECLIQRVGTEMDILGNELEKILGYVGSRDKVEVEDVEMISSGVIVSRIFDMIDAVAYGNTEKALSLYGDLIANKESPMGILYLFSRHLNILLQIKELSAIGMNKNELAKRIGIPPFTVAKYQQQAKLFKRSRLIQLLEKRADCEEKFKTGRLLEQLAVELFLIEGLTNC